MILQEHEAEMKRVIAKAYKELSMEDWIEFAATVSEFLDELEASDET